jgi:hypothetical protein
VAALDLALHNWSTTTPEDRITAGSTAEPAPEDRARIGAALGIG